MYTGQPGGSRSQKLQRSNPNGLLTWLAHQTCPVCTGLSGEPADNDYSAPTVTCRSIKCAPERAEVRHARSGAPDTLQYMTGVPPDIKRAQQLELQRSEPNGLGDVAGAPDISGVHRTVRCTIQQSATTKRLV